VLQQQRPVLSHKKELHARLESEIFSPSVRMFVFYHRLTFRSVLEVLNKKSTLVPSCVNLHADATDINIAANKNLVRTGAVAERGRRWPEGVQEEAVAGRRRQEGLHEQQRQQQSQWVLSGGHHSSHTLNGEHQPLLN
jgi:hypothetical protein